VAASGGTPAGLLQQIPGVGLVTDLYNWFANGNPYLTQREAARPYQEVEGGGNWNAQTERLHQAVYQLSMTGLMPQGAAAQSFAGVTAMGFNQGAIGEGQQPQNRQSALNFVYHNYNSMGMDVNDSLSVLQSATQDANVNLQQLSHTMEQLSQDAGNAGTSAETARQQFNAYFSQALGMGAGNGATALAGGIANMQGLLGKEFAGVNFSGELSQQRQYLLAGMTGQSPAQLQYTARNNPQLYAQQLAGQNMQFLTLGGLMTPQMTQSLQQLIAQAGGAAAVARNPGLRDSVATAFLNANQVSGNINENLWAQEISALTGVQMTPAQAFQWIVSQTVGVNEATLGTSGTTTGGTGGAPPAVVPTVLGGIPVGQSPSPGSQGNVLGGIPVGTSPKPVTPPVTPPARVPVPKPAPVPLGPAQPQAAGPFSQALTIALTPEARQLLKVLPANNDQAAATSQVPANPYVHQASR